jgi:large subunit ribosomal protein L19e
MRVLRRTLRKLRDSGKIDKHLYHELYMRTKGNVFKNKRVLLEHIHTAKAERVQQQAIKEQIEAIKKRAAEKRLIKIAKIENKNKPTKPVKKVVKKAETAKKAAPKDAKKVTPKEKPVEKKAPAKAAPKK